MAQIFHHSMNPIARLTLLALVLIAGVIGLVALGVQRSAYYTGITVPRDQPVQFSHQHHVQGLGFDCRYCHTTVEEVGFAGIPPTHTCMSCHSQIWNEAPILEPVRESYRSGRPLEWTRVYDLPDFVFFDHSIHLNKGIGCTSCHGQVDRMPLTWQETTLYMEWCLECHREPERFVRPREHVFSMEWQPPANQLVLGRELVERYNIKRMTDCSVCHR
jgi:hypothetical protein